MYSSREHMELPYHSQAIGSSSLAANEQSATESLQNEINMSSPYAGAPLLLAKSRCNSAS